MSTSLPPGKSCGICVMFEHCAVNYNRIGTETHCYYTPIAFIQRVSGKPAAYVVPKIDIGVQP